MLVDLGRNDVGRVAGSARSRSPSSWSVERYSHVMHLVSHVRGRLEPGKDAFDVLARLLPGGHAQRRAEDPRDGDHRGARADAARPLRRRGRLHLATRATWTPCITIRTVVCHGRRALDPGRARASWPTPIRRRNGSRRARKARGDDPGACAIAAQEPAPDDPGPRQLRLVHLQPGAVHGRAGRQHATSRATTRSRWTDVEALAPDAIVISPGPVHARRGRHLGRR